MAQPPNGGVERDGADRTRARLSRRQLVGAAGASIAGLGAPGGPGTSRAEPTDGVTVVHDTHFHGRFGQADGRNIAGYRTVVESQLADHDNALFVGIGDDFSPSPLGDVFRGEHMVAALNDFPLAANGVGNHEFDFGVENATQRFRASDFPWVVTNLQTPDGEPLPGTVRWTTTTVGGITLGLFGMAPRAIHRITQYPDDYIALDPVDAAAEATAALGDAGADVLVLLSHVRSDQHPTIAEAVDDLDLIVGSHSKRVFDEPRTVDGTVISEVGDEFDHVGVVTLDGSGELVDWTRVDLTGEEERHPDTWRIVERWNDRFDEEFARPRVTSGGLLDARTATTAARETGLGNLLADVLRERMDTDVAILDAGAIGSDAIYGPGPIAGTDVIEILPTSTPAVRLALSGERLRDYLASRVSALPDADGGARSGVQVSGLQYEWSGHGGDATVGNVYVGGEALEGDGTYRVATTDVATRRSGVLRDAEQTGESDASMWRVVLDGLGARRHLEPAVAHRILRVDEAVGTAELSGSVETITARFAHPAAATALYPYSFEAVTQWGHAIEARTVARSNGRVAVTFDADQLRVVATGADAIDLRVFGGFEPDDAHYGYPGAEGNPRDLPVADTPYYGLKADLDANAGALQRQ